MRDKIIFLNASIHDVPLILEARKQGFYVVTSSNKPDYPGHKYADEFIECDYNDHAGLIKICEREHITAVCCGTSDQAAYHAACLGEYFDWRGHDSSETIKTLHDKGRFKQFTKKYGIQSPVSHVFINEQDALHAENDMRYPVIIKPVDLAGGQGISVAHDKNEYRLSVIAAFARSRESRIVVEPYLTGTQHSFSSFLIDRRVAAFCSWDDLTYPGRYMISKGSLPAGYPNAEYIESVLIREIEKIADALGLVDGLFHLQCIVQNGEPYIIEVMRRSPGNWDTCMVSEATGINWDQWIVLAESGRDCHHIPKGRRMSGFWGYYAILGSRNGKMRDIIISDKIKDNIYRYVPWADSGHVITDFEHDKLGIVHLSFDTREEMDEKMAKIDELISVAYE